MGQTLSCVSKKQKHKDDIKKTKDKKLVKQVHVTGVVQEVIQPVETNDIAHVSSAVNHVPTQAEIDSVQRRQKLVILTPAPQSAKAPTPMPQQSSGKVDPPLDKATFVTQTPPNQICPSNIHNPQPVDQVARQIAQNEAKPATWTDLYWALIGSRNLQTDEEKVKALFSWLCSIPLDQRAFLTYADLEQAVNEGVEFAVEAKARKSKSPSPDSPEVVLNDLVKGESTYLRAFESLCRYSHIPCCTVKGLAKGVDYVVGMQLADQKIPPDSGDQSPISRIQHAWSAAYIDGKWALFDSMWAAERLAMNANARLSQIAQVGRMEYETDMFYFNADPKIFIYSHFPFDEQWQLLSPPVSLKQFQDSVLLKPAFFTHGLGLFSHQEGKVPVQNKLVIKISIPPTLIDVLLFTFNLKLESRDDMFEGVNLSRFGMHEISKPENVVTFSFRFPKAGAYKLTIYARKAGDPLFTDVCEYRVEAKGADSDSAAANTIPGSIDIPPFPPTSQSHYGPTEKAAEMRLKVVPTDMSAVRKSVDGVFEVRFATLEQDAKIPRMTARLKSLLHDATMLIDCILVRTVDASAPTTVGSAKSGLSSGIFAGCSAPLCIITAYLPSAGEYALEVYGAPADSEEDTSYFLVWQFLIDADCGVSLSTPVRKRLATTNLGAQDGTWSQLGIRTVSHPDPLIHVPTKGIKGLQKTRSKTELIKQFAQKTDKTEYNQAGQRLSVPNGNDAEKGDLAEESIGPLSCDLRIVLEKPATSKLCIVGQLVDISEPTEEDRTTYLLQHLDEPDDDAIPRTNERIDYLVRIPKGDHFYKFYLYAAEVDRNPAISLPLVYTYLLEAPQRLMAAEAPYIGVQYGPFPQKLEEQQANGN